MTTPRPSRLTCFAALASLALLAAVATPATRAAAAAADVDKPRADAPAARGPAMFQRFRDNLRQLDLTDDQQKQIEQIASDTREKARQVFADANGDRADARRQMAEVFRDAIRQIRDTLTPDQQRKLRNLMERDAPRRRPAAAAAADKDDQTMSGDDKMVADGEDMMMSDDGHAAKAKKAKHPSTAAAIATPKEPIDLATVKFTRLDGKAVPLSTYKGKPLVLIFGSYSCPTFRDHAKALDALQRRYATKANFLLVYTREAHPVGGWEVQRNKEAEINVPPHKDQAARIAAARQARATLGLSMPLAVDSMNDQLAAAFDAFPNSAVILDRDGQITARQKWAEPDGLAVLLDNLYTSHNPPSPQTAAN